MALHEVQLKGYSVRPGNLSLGTFDSYGIEQLHVTLDDTWSGLAVTATFNPPKGEPVEIRVPENGLIDVPAEATANEGMGAIVYCGVANGVQLITKTQGYNVITHGNVGGTEPFNPSESLATQVLQAALNAEKNSAEANTAAQSAQTAAENASVAAQASAKSASKAAAEAAAAKPYAESAKASAEATRNSENQAQQSSAEANTAKNAAQNAQAGAESSATAAAKSAKEAAASAVNLDSAVNTATQKAAAASASAAAAKASESAAASSEAAARKYANSAESAANTAGEAAAAASKAKTAAESAQAAAAASKAAAANSATQANQSANAAAKSAVAAKTSEDAAAKSAADADSTANSINDSMTQIAANKEAVSQLKEDIGHLSESKISKFYASNQGEAHLADSDNGKIMDMMLYGKSSQDGTPTPTNPIEIKSVVNPTVNVLNEDGTESQAVTIPYTLNAIPVSSGGNVTIAGQQYIADYVDVEKGKLYRKVKRLDLKDIDNTAISHGFHSNGNGYLAIIIENAVKNGQCISNKYKFATWTQNSGYLYIPNNYTVIIVDDRFTDKQTAIGLTQDVCLIYELASPIEDDLSPEQIKSLKSLSTYHPVTNITVVSEELDGYAVFNYPVSMANGWNYIKQQLNDNRDYIYNMDTQSAEAYVNSEYAVALTELEV